MSATLCLNLIAVATQRVADPAYRAVTLDQWVGALNEVAHEMSQRMKIKKRRTIFSLEANNAIYTYPDNMTQMTGLEYNPTPSDQTTWRPLGELFEDEFRAAVANSYPTHEPTQYYADAAYLHLVGMPTAALESAMRLTYWGLVDTVLSATTEYLPVPDGQRNVLQAGMLELGYQMLEKYDMAAAQRQKFEGLIRQSGVALEDRSTDRRQAIRPRSAIRGYRGQV